MRPDHWEHLESRDPHTYYYWVISRNPQGGSSFEILPGLRAQCLEIGLKVQELELQVQGLGFKGLGFRV